VPAPSPADDQRYRALVGAFTDFLWVCAPDGRLTSDMPAWRAITGQSRDELLDYGWLAGVHPEDRERVRATWRRAVDARAPYQTIYRLVGHGRTCWLEVRGAPVVDDDGTVQEWVGTAIDVTDREERHRIEAALRASLARERDMFEQVIDQAPIAVAVLEGPDHEYRLFNQRYLDLAPPGRVQVGRTVLEALPEAADTAIPLLDRAFAGEVIEMRELPIPFDDDRSFAGHRYYDFVYAPIREADRPVGVLVTATESTESVRGRDDLARRLLEERRLAEQLQRALVPDEMPHIDGVDVAVRYRSAAAATGVGGDWYDVLEVAPGRVLLVMGDVCGKGLRAATAMSQVRSAVRAYALAEPSPASVLGHVAAYVDALRLADMVTAVVGLLDLEAGTLRIANAGHLPPLVLGAGGAPAFALVPADPPLGADGAAYREATIALAPGDRLAFFTDGVVEHRGRSLADTMEQLRAAVERGLDEDAGTARALCDALDAHVRATGAGIDDAALLVCAVTGRAEPAGGVVAVAAG
jgi:PAS domain S-box-containing protein